MNGGNVETLPLITGMSTPEQVLRTALDGSEMMDHVIVISAQKDGNMVYTFSKQQRQQSLWALECARLALMGAK